MPEWARITTKTLALALLGLWLAVTPSLAVLPDEILKDPVLEARARALSGELRCMVCQNQSIDDSDAELARDLRVLVRERISAGDTDEQVLDYLVSRYGEFVLLKPQISARNMVLWAMPLIVLVVVGSAMILMIRRRGAPAVASLSDEEKARLTKLLGERD